MQHRLLVAALAVVVIGFASVADAQPGRGGPGGAGFGRGGGGMSMFALLRVEAVQKELDLTDAQISEINELLASLRQGGQRGGEGRQRPGGEGRQRPQRDNDASAPAANGTQFVAFLQDDADAQRRERFEQFRAQAEARQKEAQAKLEKILKPSQFKRLREIYIQVAGAGALQDASIAKELGITDEQTEEMANVRREAFSGIRELFQNGDRDAIREKMTDLREQVNKDTLAVLTTSQREKFKAMQGKKFDLPEGALQGGRGGDGGRTRGRPGADGNADGEGRRRGRPDAE